MGGDDRDRRQGHAALATQLRDGEGVVDRRPGCRAVLRPSRQPRFSRPRVDGDDLPRRPPDGIRAAVEQGRDDVRAVAAGPDDLGQEPAVEPADGAVRVRRRRGPAPSSRRSATRASRSRARSSGTSTRSTSTSAMAFPPARRTIARTSSGSRSLSATARGMPYPARTTGTRRREEHARRSRAERARRPGRRGARPADAAPRRRASRRGAAGTPPRRAPIPREKAPAPARALQGGQGETIAPILPPVARERYPGLDADQPAPLRDASRRRRHLAAGRSRSRDADRRRRRLERRPDPVRPAAVPARAS